MTNPSMPQLPGAGAMSDTLEFMKNLWGNVKLPGVSIPGMVMPSLSVEEINKQITDLKAVESWLTVNMNLLHGTIKALEVQSATISTLQSMSSNFSSAMQSATIKPAEESTPFHSPFSKPAPVAQAAAASWPEFKTELKPEPEVAPQAKTESAAKPAGDSSAAEQLPNPAVWWNMLQDQFKQAVAGAITPAPKDAPKAADKSKPKSKTATTPRSTKPSATAKPLTEPAKKTPAKKSAAVTKSAAPRKA